MFLFNLQVATYIANYAFEVRSAHGNNAYKWFEMILKLKLNNVIKYLNQGGILAVNPI